MFRTTPMSMLPPTLTSAAPAAAESKPAAQAPATAAADGDRFVKGADVPMTDLAQAAPEGDVPEPRGDLFPEAELSEAKPADSAPAAKAAEPATPADTESLTKALKAAVPDLGAAPVDTKDLNKLFGSKLEELKGRMKADDQRLSQIQDVELPKTQPQSPEQLALLNEMNQLQTHLQRLQEKYSALLSLWNAILAADAKIADCIIANMVA